ncbi:MAG: helix-turn-helix transcriptional regulator [Spirochaetes bacterium]|nr:helix-turn-helix transcriptional regulator [Spirochaetota bacterium]
MTNHPITFPNVARYIRYFPELQPHLRDVRGESFVTGDGPYYIKRITCRHVVGAGFVRPRFWRQPIQVHTHAQALLLLHLPDGRAEIELGRQRFSGKAGDTFFVPPGTRIAGVTPVVPPDGYYWLVIEMPRRGERFLDLSTDDTAHLFRRLKKKPVSMYRSGDSFRRLFTELHASLTATDELKNIGFTNAVIALLMNAVRSPASSPDVVSPIVERAREHITALTREHAIGMASLCASTGASPSTIRRIFKRETGLSLKQYHLSKKIEHACNLLAAKRMPVTDVAYHLGFASPAHFATAFRKFTGTSPKAFARIAPLKDAARNS